MTRMSKQVNYNQIKIERVALNNLKYAFLVCDIMFICSFIALLFEFAKLLRKVAGSETIVKRL